MDEALGWALEAIFKFLRYIFWDIFVNVIVYNIGRLSLLAVTSGKFPRSHHLPRHEGWVIVAGALMVAIIWLGIVVYNRSAGMG